MLRKLRRKLSPNYTQKCEITTVNGLRRHSIDIEKGSVERLPNEIPHPHTARTMSTTTGSTTLPPINDPPQTGDSKSDGTARSSDSTVTAAAENEEQLLGVGHLPKDVQAEQELQEAIKKAIGPPAPTLE